MAGFSAVQSQSLGFYLVFGLAIVAFVTLSVLVVVKVVAKDRASRKAWLANRVSDQGKGADVTPK